MDVLRGIITTIYVKQLIMNTFIKLITGLNVYKLLHHLTYPGAVLMAAILILGFIGPWSLKVKCSNPIGKGKKVHV